MLKCTSFLLGAEKFLIRWKGLSHLHVSWEAESDLIAELEGHTQKVSERSERAL